jgi:DNA-binding MarR family transcriptional regulator
MSLDADESRVAGAQVAEARGRRTIYLVRQLQLTIYAGLLDQLSEFDVTPTQYMLLSLASRRGGLSSADLARRFRVTPQSMNEAISALERKGFIERTEDPGHRKILRIGLTAQGAKLLKRCDRRVDQFELALFETITPSEHENLRKTLSKLVAKLSIAAPSPPRIRRRVER